MLRGLDRVYWWSGRHMANVKEGEGWQSISDGYVVGCSEEPTIWETDTAKA